MAQLNFRPQNQGRIISSKASMLHSSLHCNISLSFCAFLYNGVCFDQSKLSVSGIIVSQKGSNGDRKLQFLGWDYKENEGNALHCTKRTQNKTNLVRWRLFTYWLAAALSCGTCLKMLILRQLYNWIFMWENEGSLNYSTVGRYSLRGLKFFQDELCQISDRGRCVCRVVCNAVIMPT